MFALWYFAVAMVAIRAVSSSTSLPARFYKPGRGLFLERWMFTSKSYPLREFDKIPNYPGCPTHTENLNKFEKNQLIRGTYQHCRFSANFVSPQSGNHKFSVLCNNHCKLEIEIKPFGVKTILTTNSITIWDWNDRKKSQPVNLMNGFRYLVRLYMYGNGQYQDFAALGVEFPDGTEVNPIDERFVWRSTTFYEWQGLLGQQYNGIIWDNSRKMSEFYKDNAASFPDNPTLYRCLPTLYEPGQNLAEYYAMKFVGYINFPENTQYEFKFYANEIAELKIIKNSTTKIVKTADQRKDPTIFDGGSFIHSTWYPVEATRVESKGSDLIKVQYRHGSNAYSSSWSGKLKNILGSHTAYRLSPPTLTMISSSVISAKLSKEPFLPATDYWIPAEKYDILAFETSAGESAVVQKREFTGNLPHEYNFTGLKNYTMYSFYAHYYGQINGSNTYNIITSSSEMRTDENVPEVPPRNIYSRVISSKSILVSWHALVDPDLLNGLCTGYEVKYRVKEALQKNWTSLIIEEGTREFKPTHLEEYTKYEVIVAARTSKGSGVFSQPIERTTKEDKPSAPPVEIVARNTSSSSIHIEWDEVPYWDQNGIITKYKIYISKHMSMSGSKKHSVTDKFHSINGLDIWEFYYIQVSALTAIGEGPKSNVTGVRTDEDKPGGPPTKVKTKALSSYSINVTWSEIQASKTYGVIVSYKVTYTRKDGQGSVKVVVTSEKTALLLGLASYVDYDIKVAGGTIKGFGVNSSKVTEKTLPSKPTAAPVNINGQNISSTAIQVTWGLVPTEEQNGVISGYNIMYKAKKDSGNAWKNITVSSRTRILNITGLEYYTMYNVKMAGINSVGIGVYSNITDIRTDAYAPGRPPINLTGNFLNHTAIMMSWGRVPEAFRFGTIEGYRLYIKDKTTKKASWRNVTIPNGFDGNDTFSYTFAGLKIYTPYLFKITAFTIKAEGPSSRNITVWTDEYIPEEHPKNVTGLGETSTEIFLHWDAMEEIHGDANGKVLGHTVKYHVIECHEDRPKGCDEHEIFNLTVNGTDPIIKIPNLRKYTQYNISIQMFNSKGRGNFSREITVRTDEDKPDAPPTYVEAWPSTYESVKVFWSPIPESLRNGIILGYRIFYKPIDVALRKYSRSPRAVNPLAIYGAEPGEKMKEVNETTFETEITELQEYHWYQMRVGAYTSKGLGVTFILNGTCKQIAPSVAPLIASLKDMYDFYEVSLNWKEVNKTHANGEVLGYRIKYWLTEQNYVPVSATNVSESLVFAPNTTLKIEDLQPYATYGINVSAFTEGGYGPESPVVYGETCRCPKIFSSSTLHLPPLVHKNLANESVMQDMINEAIIHCCGNCSGSHGVTEVDWNRDASNTSSLKNNRVSAMNSLNLGTHVTLPFYNKFLEIQDKKTYTYVPIVPVTTFLVFKKKITLKVLGNFGAKIVLDSLWQQYPLLFVSFVLSLLAGIVLWAAESGINTAEFPSTYLRGAGSGLWLAFITMTTVGYGDLNLMTKFGRFIAMTWMLIGLVLTSLIIGSLSTIFGTEFVYDPQPIDTDGKVLGSNEALMIASKLFGRKVTLGNVSDGNFVHEQLLSGRVSKVFLDSFQANALRKFLDHPEIVLDSIHNAKASYGVLLSGDAKRISKCVKKYVSENEQRLFERIAQSTTSFKLESSFQYDLVKHMMSPHSDFMEKTTLYGCKALALLTFIGVIYEIVRYIRGRAKINAAPSEKQAFFEEIGMRIDSFERAVMTKTAEIEAQHTEERLKLYKMQAGKYEQLLKYYPDLPIYDPTLPKVVRKNEVKMNPDEESGFELCYEDDSSDGEENGMPIDYKRSEINLQL